MVMIEQEKYLLNPTASSALSYWRTCHIEVPEGVHVISESDFDPEKSPNHQDSVYFKMLHDLEKVGEVRIPADLALSAGEVIDFVRHINSCYEDLGISLEEAESYMNREVYESDLWICLRERETNLIVASGIAECDKESGEGYLDWIQVSPDYRGRGLARAIVNELLQRLRDRANFVTVSGREDNLTRPDRLYERCGFKEKHLWHVLRGRGDHTAACTASQNS